MEWNILGTAIHLSQSFAGAFISIFVMLYAFWVVDFIIKVYKEKNTDWVSYRWKVIRMAVAGFLMASVISTASTYRPRITVEPRTEPPGMSTQDRPAFKDPVTNRDKLAKGVENTDEQTKKSWDNNK